MTCTAPTANTGFTLNGNKIAMAASGVLTINGVTLTTAQTTTPPFTGL